MKHLGDITKVNGYEIEPVDCICFGSPCQDLSIAGKRNGLSGERSGLFMEAVRIIKEMRKHECDMGRTGNDIRPRYAIWENVPGAFSSNKGEDFRVVLEELTHIVEPDVTIPRRNKWEKSGLIHGDNWSIAWRTLDAQYWGVPQRRKRIALVMDFTGRSAGEILFESESLSRNPNESVTSWEEVARTFADCTRRSDSKSECTDEERDCTTLKLRHTGSENHGGGSGAQITEDLSSTLSCVQDQTLF